MAYQQAAPLPSLSSLFDPSHILSADQGSYALSGQDATFSVVGAGGGEAAPLPHLGLLFEVDSGSAVLSADYGTYALSGQDATLARSRIFAADAGSYSYSGQIALFSYVNLAQGGDPAPLPHLGLLLRQNTYTLTADPGSYSIVGSDAIADFSLTAEQGSYSITGQDAALLKTTIMVAESGTYAISGQDAGLEIGSPARTMPADYSTYAITGYDAGLNHGYLLQAEQGFYALLGQGAEFAFGFNPTHYVLTAESGRIYVTGRDAELLSTASARQDVAGGYWPHYPVMRRKRKKEDPPPVLKEAPPEVVAPVLSEKRKRLGVKTKVMEPVVTEDMVASIKRKAEERAKRKKRQQEDDMLLL